MTNDIVLFRTHKFNNIIDNNLKHLKKSKKQVEVLFDYSNSSKQDNCVNFSLEDIKASGYSIGNISQLYRTFMNNPDRSLIKRFPTLRMQQIWYNIGHYIVLFYDKYPNYKYYWSVEYDVKFKGDWDDFFSIYNNSKIDYLGVDIQETKIDDTKGYWGLFDFDVPYKKRLRCFGTIQRLSNRLLKAVSDELKQGRHTYFEQLFPSVAKHYNYSVKDLNEIAVNKTGQQIYTGSTMTYEDITLNQYVHLANSKNKLFHPVR